MRRACVLLFVCASAVLPQAARGDTLTLGVVSFDNLIADAPPQIGVNMFDITNFTGDPVFGTFTSAAFQNSTLTIDGGQPILLGDIAAQTFSFSLQAIQFPTTQGFASAEFKATLDQTTFLLPDGITTFTANSAAIDVLLLPMSGNNLVAGTDFALINVSNAPSAVPEPNSWLLLGVVLVAIFYTARVAIRRA